MIVVDEVCVVVECLVGVVVECLVGVVAVYLWAVVCGVNLGNRRLHWQGVDSARQWGVAAAR